MNLEVQRRAWQRWACFFFAVSLALLSGVLGVQAQLVQSAIDKGWRFRAVNSADHPEMAVWHAATVPGVVQTDLLHAGLIPDPFYADNEKRLQWIGLTDWEYTTNFSVSADLLAKQHVELVFDGLDTYADVTLNGSPILELGSAGSSANQFRSWRVDVKAHLHAGSNTLRILFHSPTNLLTPVIAKLPLLIPGTGYEPLDAKNGVYPVSHYMRKAPYSYGWDWGPKFVTEGIWRPVHLEAWNNLRVTGFHLQQQSVTAERALVEAHLDLTSDFGGPTTLQWIITAPNGTQLPRRTQQVIVDRGTNRLSFPFRIDHPERWYPNGYGSQSRYTVSASVLRVGRVLGAVALKTGLRSVDLQRTPDLWGRSFAFVINGVPIFAKGANFVPLDSFAPSVTDGRRREILTAARDAHMNMLRIWGGGFYESDAFYSLCDELGLMVWHDFVFGGALVPGDQSFQENVRAEAIEQVQRLSDHPSLVLWCGNNEVENAWREWPDHLEFERSITPEQRERIWQDYVVLFRDILKSVVATDGNGVPYWPSSPGSNFDEVPVNTQDGEMHSWKVWSAGAPFTDYAKVHPRFLSEFGFQSMPNLETVRAYAGTNEDLTSPALQNHERFLHGYDRMQEYLVDNFRSARDFASFIYLSQVMQAEAIKFGVETMRARRPETMGTLYWQLDDCWPVASWSSIDYFGRWKALQYYAVRFYAPLLIVAEVQNDVLAIHVVSDEQQSRHAILRMRLMKFDGTLSSEQIRAVDVAALGSTPVQSIPLIGVDSAGTFGVLTLEQNGAILSSSQVYFAKPKDLALPPVSIEKSLDADRTGFTLELRAPVLARDVQIELGAVDAKLSDNFFDLLPNERRRVHIDTSATLAQVRSALTLRSMVSATK